MISLQYLDDIVFLPTKSKPIAKNFSGRVVLDVLVLAAPDLALYLVLLVVWEEYQGK